MNHLTQNAYTYNGNTKSHLVSWLNHSSLHFWMQNLAREKNQRSDIDHVEVELTTEDIIKLISIIEQNELSNMWKTGWMFGMGFGMGIPKDDQYRAQDIDFCYEAKFQLFMGIRVFYVGVIN
jgi:hypothetical protein